MRVLVTGATGFIGRFLIPHLLQHPDTAVSLLLREQYSHPSNLPPHLTHIRDRFQAVYADLRNVRLTARAVRQAAPDAVIHLAAAGVTDPFLSVDTAIRHNINGTVNLLRACFQETAVTQRFTTARTPGEHTAMNVYAAGKAAAWKFCQMYARTRQWPIVGAMIFQAYGPGQPAGAFIPSAMRAAQAGEDFPMTAGVQQRDWIYVEDAAAGLAAALTANLAAGTTVELGTGQLTSVRAVAEMVYELIDGTGRPRPGLLPDRPGEEAAQVADAARTRELLGWETAVSLREGLTRLLNQHDPLSRQT